MIEGSGRRECSGESITTSPSISSGLREAAAIATQPPSEWPLSTTGSGQCASRRSIRSPAMASTE